MSKCFPIYTIGLAAPFCVPDLEEREASGRVFELQAAAEELRRMQDYAESVDEPRLV